MMFFERNTKLILETAKMKEFNHRQHISFFSVVIYIRLVFLVMFTWLHSDVVWKMPPSSWIRDEVQLVLMDCCPALPPSVQTLYCASYLKDNTSASLHCILLCAAEDVHFSVDTDNRRHFISERRRKKFKLDDSQHTETGCRSMW